ncbi:uncharacterized protein LOC142590457 isoform X5 [Dermacentor variabilis]|uniref:uncharacterized protein LOC142590457 isoform X5 n=1 Tax=Dermacentor variabilis TaxID=34621 RepID=UPI003F5CBB8A
MSLAESITAKMARHAPSKVIGQVDVAMQCSLPLADKSVGCSLKPGSESRSVQTTEAVEQLSSTSASRPSLSPSAAKCDNSKQGCVHQCHAVDCVHTSSQFIEYHDNDRRRSRPRAHLRKTGLHDEARPARHDISAATGIYKPRRQGPHQRARRDFREHNDESVAPFCTGSLASMEKKRNNRAAAHGSASTQDSESEDRDDQAKVILELQATVERLESELRQTKAQLQQARDCLDSSRMVRRLKHILDQTIGASGAIGGGSVEPGTVVSAPKVDLGEGILLDESTLTRLRRDAKNSGSRFARGLLKVLFSSEELENKSLFGRRSNAHKGAAQKEALDPRRVNAILSYTARHFDATTGEIKNTLSSMLARGY